MEVVIPVYNEERDLPRCIPVLHSFLKEHLIDRPWRIVIADNGSTDATLEIAAQLSRGYPEVAFTHIPVKGRGRALKQAFIQGQADILSYMDVDLATGLEAFPNSSKPWRKAMTSLSAPAIWPAPEYIAPSADASTPGDIISCSGRSSGQRSATPSAGSRP